MLPILAIETAINSHSIALFNQGEIDVIKSPELFKQSDSLFLHINEILGRNRLNYRDLGKMGVVTGPGSFTGIRIGVAAVRGIKKALPQLEIVGYSTLELMAFQAKSQMKTGRQYLSLLNAFAHEYYCQKFDSEVCAVSDISVISQSAVDDEVDCIALKQEQELLGVRTNSIFVEIDAVTLLNKMISDPGAAKKVAPLYIKPPNIHNSAKV